MKDSLHKRDYCCLIGDCRYDSPGHSSKYLTFSMLDQATDTIALMFVTQYTEAGNSSNMKMIGFIKTPNNSKEKTSK